MRWRWASPRPWRAPPWWRHRIVAQAQPKAQANATERRAGDRVPADVEHGRQGMHEHLRSGRRGLRGGVAAAGIHPRHAVVDVSYQPVSYKLDSKLGTEAEFKNMVQAVLRRRRGHHRRRGAEPDHRCRRGRRQSRRAWPAAEYNGSTGNYPGFATEAVPGRHHGSSDFHSCAKNISDYANQQEVQECRLSSMWDFDSESEKVAGYSVRLS